MSLVIGFIGRTRAIMAGDMREILIGGDGEAIAALEGERYSGTIRTEGELTERAEALGARIVVRDDRNKVSRVGEILIGEVGEREKGLVRARRLYATAGISAIVEKEGSRIVSVEIAEGSRFVVLGNEATRQVACRCIREYWKTGTFHDAVRVIVTAMETAARITPTVSRKYILLQTRGRGDLRALLEEEKKAGSILGG